MQHRPFKSSHKSSGTPQADCIFPPRVLDTPGSVQSVEAHRSKNPSFVASTVAGSHNGGSAVVIRGGKGRAAAAAASTDGTTRVRSFTPSPRWRRGRRTGHTGMERQGVRDGPRGCITASAAGARSRAGPAPGTQGPVRGPGPQPLLSTVRRRRQGCWHWGPAVGPCRCRVPRRSGPSQ